MFKDIISQQQSVVFRTLKNSLKNEHLSHAYLFVGKKGTLKKETAIWLAQSILCENKDEDIFACESCNSCNRIASNNYVDFIFLDGSEKAIKNEDIADLQIKFQKTALEKAGKKVFIINGAEKLTIKAANSLLKFIEEPSGSITGIFICESLENILPTIISRCQTISFKPLSKDAFFSRALELEEDLLNAHFISNLVNTIDEVDNLHKSENYSMAVKFFMQFMDLFFKERNMGNFYLMNNFIKINKGNSTKVDFRLIFSLFVDIALVFVNDYIHGYNVDDETYCSIMTLAKEHNMNFSLFLNAFSETKDALNKAANGMLLVDQLLYKLLEV